MTPKVFADCILQLWSTSDVGVTGLARSRGFDGCFERGAALEGDPCRRGRLLDRRSGAADRQHGPGVPGQRRRERREILALAFAAEDDNELARRAMLADS